MQRRHHSYRPWAAVALASLAIGAVLAAAGCAGGGSSGEARPSDRLSQAATERTPAREPASTASRSGQPTRSRTAGPTVTTQEATPATSRETTTQDTATQDSTRPPTSAVVAPEPQRTTATPAEAAHTTTSAVPAAGTSTGVGPLGWFLLFAFVVLLIVGVLIVVRSQRRSAWAEEARALAAQTTDLTGAPLSSLLATGTAAQRSLTWPALRTELANLPNRWNVLFQRASGDDRRNWSAQVSARLQDLLGAVDAENEAMARGDDWTLLRPRVQQAQQSLATVLEGRPMPEPPAAGQPGPAFQA